MYLTHNKKNFSRWTDMRIIMYKVSDSKLSGQQAMDLMFCM
jgi:hypothetical protein